MDPLSPDGRRKVHSLVEKVYFVILCQGHCGGGARRHAALDPRAEAACRWD